jgi:YidC/Oxa1 family membrane protein insertase
MFDILLFKPIFNLLVFIYDIIPGRDFGVAIIILTVLIRFAFSPLSIKALVSQRQISKLQPKIKELQEKFKNDKQALGQATMELYKQNNANPFSGCLPILIQIPIFIALYRALSFGLKPEGLNFLYPFISNPGSIKDVAFGFLVLSKKSYVLAILTGVLQWYQSRQSMAFQGQTGANSTTDAMSKQMLYFFPVMIIIIAWNLSAGLALYLAITTAYSIAEQIYIKRKYS